MVATFGAVARVPVLGTRVAQSVAVDVAEIPCLAREYGLVAPGAVAKAHRLRELVPLAWRVRLVGVAAIGLASSVAFVVAHLGIYRGEKSTARVVVPLLSQETPSTECRTVGVLTCSRCELSCVVTAAPLSLSRSVGTVGVSSR